MSLSDLERGLKSLAAATPAYEEAGKYYDGTVEEFFTNEKIGEKIKGSASSFRLAFAAIPVDARVGLLDIASIVTENDATTETLRTKVWDENELDQDIENTFREAGIRGDAYMTVWPADLDEADPSAVEVFANSPLSTRIIYSAENSRRALFAVRVWESDITPASGKDPLYRANVFYADRVEQYISREGRKNPQGADDFEPLIDEDDDEDDGTIENPWGVLPVFHFRQGSKPYGTPLHRRAYGSQDAITKLNSTHMGTIDFTGYPQRYALVDSTSDDESEDDAFFDYSTTGIVEPGDVGEVRKKRSKLKSGPGETWWLEGVKSVGQFETAKHDVFLEPIKFQVRAMARLTNTPAAEFDIETGEVPSGVSYVRSYAPLHRDVNQMRRAHGRTLEALLELALAMLGFPGERVTVKWSPLQVALGSEDWAIVKEKTLNGVPLKAALIAAGIDDDEVETWFPDDVPALSLNMIEKVSAAMTGFGTGVTLGALTLADIVAMLPSVFTKDRVEPERPAIPTPPPVAE